ncbi:hypothetical protein M431DRAFT_481712 [Trichoderma harzianum CBS 226.95]|uniref:Uncharacterized protein n=1 Tax=Trichoderma harzianum CBS 226.95 TaxID=983964 RepID=A0A2T4ABM5_TRIHA|nr:hypothetical protein M431DRAFT_481712 [Trichoderma harzianum CBS 226.95]PTB54481.1 hypothetical protein M431DRAFT_481712 [Trichoderma harzianum CBS 226.95]
MQCSQASSYFPHLILLQKSQRKRQEQQKERHGDSAWREAREDPNNGSVSAQKPTKNVTLELQKPRRMRPLFIRLQQNAKGPKNVSSKNGRRFARAKTRAKTEKERGQTGIVGRRKKNEARKSWTSFDKREWRWKKGMRRERERERAGTREKDVKAAVRCQGRSEKEKSLSVSRCAVLAILGQRRDEEEANAMRRARVDFGAGVAAAGHRYRYRDR